MKGNDNVTAALNSLLPCELAAMDQYFIHSRMYHDWGLTKLFERIAHEFDDEKGHAEQFINRILFLEGTPNMVARDAINIGADTPAMLKSDLNIDYKVTADLKEPISLCEAEKDYVTRAMLQVLLQDTEMDHAYWLEQQLGLIYKPGLENYLKLQL